jgi:cytochrome oxidase Cu insertion factor (SCO1/SenC/PrrC family)
MQNIKVSAEQWNKLVAIKAEKSALEKQIKALQVTLEIPEAKDIAENVTLLVVDGNGDTRGKYTVSYREGYKVAGGWVGRLS